MTPLIGQSVILFGGDGDDLLNTLNGRNNVLVGGEGNDHLTGGVGRDLLIGGNDRDMLFGSGGDDILIAGRTTHDNHISSLGAVMAEWTSTSGYTDRVGHLRGTLSGGMNGGTRLRGGIEVLGDSQMDLINGGPGQDFWFATTLGSSNTKDKLIDRASDEILEATT